MTDSTNLTTFQLTKLINLFITTFLLKWGDSYDGHGEMYYDYNHGPSYKHHDSYHEPVYGKADEGKPIVYKPEPYKSEPYKPEPSYKPEPTYS